ncbi:MAG: type II toxin-antitoxin system PemK/MazF family toxin [Rhizomicrobium sp.]
MPFEFGDVVLVPFPFTDQTTSKKRPAVIVSSNPYGQAKLDVVLMAITSQLRPSPGGYEVGLADWRAAGLLKESVVKPIFATVEKKLVLKTLGRLGGADASAVKKAIGEILGPLG